jgi:hypothetical protein
VKAKDVDPVRGGARDEAADEVARQRPRAHEEAPAQGDPERRLAARTDGADALPRALDAAAHRRVEAAASGHLEVSEAGLVEAGGQLEHLSRGDARGKRFLGEEADCRIDERGHP